MRSSDRRRAATLAHLYNVETKANPAKLGSAVLKSDLRRQGVSVAASASKGDMARALKASPVVAANRAKIAALLQEARKSMGLRGTKTWSQANADYLASRLDEVAKLDLDEATLKQVREAAASIRAKGVTSGREARAQLLGQKPTAVRPARIKKDAAAVAADNQVRGLPVDMAPKVKVAAPIGPTPTKDMLGNDALWSAWRNSMSVDRSVTADHVRTHYERLFGRAMIGGKTKAEALKVLDKTRFTQVNFDRA